MGDLVTIQKLSQFPSVMPDRNKWLCSWGLWVSMGIDTVSTENDCSWLQFTLQFTTLDTLCHNVILFSSYYTNTYMFCIYIIIQEWSTSHHFYCTLKTKHVLQLFKLPTFKSWTGLWLLTSLLNSHRYYIYAIWIESWNVKVRVLKVGKCDFST